MVTRCSAFFAAMKANIIGSHHRDVCRPFGVSRESSLGATPRLILAGERPLQLAGSMARPWL